jgi:phytoene dehydrogenase-like protein
MKKIAIIGSGLGGLVAGNLLARKGHQVTIFESHTTPGGYTAGFTRKGYYFESGTLSFESSWMIFKAMRDLGLADKVDFIRHQARWVSEDFAASPESYEDFKTMLIAAYPGEVEKLRAYFAEVDPMYEGMRDLDRAGAERSLRTLPGLLRGLLKIANAYRKYAHVTVPEFTRRFFSEDSILYRMLKGLGYPDSGTVILGGAYYTIFDDYWTVRQGMQAWADVLADNFKKLGGELKLKARVERIVTRDGTAVGVESDGVRYDADYVISACDYKKTFLSLLDDRSLVPPETLRRIEDAAVSEGICTVYLGLDMPPDQLERRMQHHYVHYFDEAPGTDVRDSADADFFSKVSVSLFSPSLMNPALAPAGKSSLMLQAICPLRWMDNWGGGDKERYRELKDQVMEALIDKAAAVVPELREHIELKDAATPLTYERYTGNTDGATSAWSWNPNNRFFKRMISVNVDTPVENLYIGSCWAMQMGGVPGALMAANKCARKIKS